MGRGGISWADGLLHHWMILVDTMVMISWSGLCCVPLHGALPCCRVAFSDFERSFYSVRGSGGPALSEQFNLPLPTMSDGASISERESPR